MASSLITGINHAMARLVDIWDSIGIMEEQRIERMQTVKNYIEVSRSIYCAPVVLCIFVNYIYIFFCWCSTKVLLKDMITEEESLRHCIKTSIITTQKQLETLCLELSVEPYKVGLAGWFRYFWTKGLNFKHLSSKHLYVPFVYGVYNYVQSNYSCSSIPNHYCNLLCETPLSVISLQTFSNKIPNE